MPLSAKQASFLPWLAVLLGVGITPAHAVLVAGFIQLGSGITYVSAGESFAKRCHGSAFWVAGQTICFGLFSAIAHPPFSWLPIGLLGSFFFILEMPRLFSRALRWGFVLWLVLPALFGVSLSFANRSVPDILTTLNPWAIWSNPSPSMAVVGGQTLFEPCSAFPAPLDLPGFYLRGLLLGIALVVLFVVAFRSPKPFLPLVLACFFPLLVPAEGGRLNIHLPQASGAPNWTAPSAELQVTYFLGDSREWPEAIQERANMKGETLLAWHERSPLKAPVWGGSDSDLALLFHWAAHDVSAKGETIRWELFSTGFLRRQVLP